MNWSGYLVLGVLAAGLACEAQGQNATDHPFSGRSITFRTGYTLRTCLPSNTQCRTDRVPFGTWEQIYISPDGRAEVFTHSEHTYTFTLGQPDDRENEYRFEGRDFVRRTSGQIWTFRAQGNRCVITVRTERRSDDPLRTTINLARQECQLTAGRRPWSHAD
jgi:hypothetical protein